MAKKLIHMTAALNLGSLLVAVPTPAQAGEGYDPVCPYPTE